MKPEIITALFGGLATLIAAIATLVVAIRSASKTNDIHAALGATTAARRKLMTPRLRAQNVGVVIESSDVSAGQVQRWIAAILIQCARDFCPRWDLRVPRIKQFAKESDVPADWTLVVFLPSSDVADALGYHDETPDGRTFARIFTSGLSPDDISETFSHEILEGLLDPQCNRYALATNGDLWSLEACDAVQGQRYWIDLGDKRPIAVADFVTPEFYDFTPADGAQYNFNQDKPLPEPFTLAKPDGWSALLRDGKAVQIFASKGATRLSERFLRIQENVGQ